MTAATSATSSASCRPTRASGRSSWSHRKIARTPPPEFVLEPKGEVTDFYFVNTTNAEERFFYRVNIRMRAGSHHMINRMLDADRSDGFSGAGGDNFTVGGSTGRSFRGSQRPNQDRPMGTFEVPPENAGLGDRARGAPAVLLQPAPLQPRASPICARSGSTSGTTTERRGDHAIGRLRGHRQPGRHGDRRRASTAR